MGQGCISTWPRETLVLKEDINNGLHKTSVLMSFRPATCAHCLAPLSLILICRLSFLFSHLSHSLCLSQASVPALEQALGAVLGVRPPEVGARGAPACGS
jgi:hypothetical protein